MNNNMPFTTSKGNGLFVPVPENKSKFQVVFENLLISDDPNDYDVFGENGNPQFVMKLPKGNWQIMGLSTEITSEQAEKMVKKINSFPDSYVDYSGLGWAFGSPIQSFNSLKEHLGVVDTNPMGLEPAKNIDGHMSKSGSWIVTLNPAWEIWQSHQDKVKKYVVLFNPL